MTPGGQNVPDDKNLNTVQQYVGDMVALETHIEEAIDGQLKEVKDHPLAAAAVERFHTMVKSHRDALKSHLESIGGSESHPIKSAVSAVVGTAAGLVDNLRTKGISKSLRDNYTAFNLAAIGYAMLHTTAHLLGQPNTADIAERHLRDYTRAVQEINQLIADVVAWELRKDGHTVNDETVRHATDTLNRAWRDTSPSTSATRIAA
jgi:ferritin-like metal-binding protein YciE